MRGNPLRPGAIREPVKRQNFDTTGIEQKKKRAIERNVRALEANPVYQAEVVKKAAQRRRDALNEDI